jgi:hypothetical protein
MSDGGSARNVSGHIVPADVESMLTAIRNGRQAAAGAGPPPPIGLHLLLGPRIGPALGNTLRNLEEERITLVEAVFER